MGDTVSGIFGGGDEPDYSQMEFKPYSVSSNLGSTKLDQKKQTASVTLSPEMQKLFDAYMSGAFKSLPSEQDLQFAGQMSDYGQTLFGKSTSALDAALNTDINKATSDYYNQQLNLLSAGRAAEEARLADTLFKTGRSGVATGYGSGYLNPEQFALLKAREEQNALLALNAEDRARAIRANDIASALNLGQAGIGYYGMGESLPANSYATSGSIAGQGINLTGSLNPYLGYGIQAGQASAQAGANIVGAQQQAQANNMGFFGGLLGAATTAAGFAGGWGNLFSMGGTSAAASPFAGLNRVSGQFMNRYGG